MTWLESHLLERHLDVKAHSIFLSEQEQCATFPLWNLSGQMVGYQSYRPHADKIKMNDPFGKYYTYRKKECWVPWGLETLNWTGFKSPVFVAEGIFDACRLTEFGHAALATMTNSPPRDFLNFLSFLTRPIVVVLDNDLGGAELTQLGGYVEMAPNGDLGDSPPEFVTYLISKYTQ